MLLYEDNDIAKFLKDRFSRLDELQAERCQYYPYIVYDYEGDSWSSPAEDSSWDGFQEICDIIGAAQFKSGASKLVFFFDEIPNFVIKIPFRGERHYNDDSWESIGNIEWYSNAPLENGEDYCGAEEEFYERAFDYGVQDFFAETRFLTWVGNIKIYLAEKCDKVYNYRVNKPSNDSFCKACELSRSFSRDIDEDCLACVIEEYNARVFSFMNFLQDMNIGDLHDGNFGYLNGRIVVFDYSGFEDC